MRFTRHTLAVFAAILMSMGAVSAETTTHRASLAQAGGAPIQLDVQTTCGNGVTLFKIVNAGDAWPRSGTLNVVRLTANGAETLVRRQMRFAAGQKASFRLKNPSNDTLGIFIQPSWYDRAPQLDAKATC